MSSFFSDTAGRISVERSFEAWEDVLRHELDLADRLIQGFTGLIQSRITPPSFTWPNTHTPKLFDVDFTAQTFVTRDLGLKIEKNTHGVSAIFDIGSRLGQAGLDFGENLNGIVQQFFRQLLIHEDLSALTKKFQDFGGGTVDSGLVRQTLAVVRSTVVMMAANDGGDGLTVVVAG
ncbi:hypothetical protein R6Q57_022116 [Mikania cordata]